LKPSVSVLEIDAPGTAAKLLMSQQNFTLHVVGVDMNYTRFGAVALLSLSAAVTASSAHAICTNKWADVTLTCPRPVPYTGPKTLTDTSRNLPTVGTPGLYKNYGNGYDVRVYLHGNGTGYQKFPWQK